MPPLRRWARQLQHYRLIYNHDMMRPGFPRPFFMKQRKYMISAEDFAFTIGYDGLTAIVDGKAKKQYGQLGYAELAKAGMWRAAFAKALHSGDKSQMDGFKELWNSHSNTSFSTVEEFSRLFGVKEEEVRKINSL